MVGRRTEVFCLVCATRNEYDGKIVSYEAYKMRAVYYTYKRKRRLFGYVCPNCGHVFRLSVPPLVEEPHLIKVDKAVMNSVYKVIIPTEHTEPFSETLRKIYGKIYRRRKKVAT
jgi:hypothetical protein